MPIFPLDDYAEETPGGSRTVPATMDFAMPEDRHGFEWWMTENECWKCGSKLSASASRGLCKTCSNQILPIIRQQAQRLAELARERRTASETV